MRSRCILRSFAVFAAQDDVEGDAFVETGPVHGICFVGTIRRVSVVLSQRFLHQTAAD